MESRDFRRLAIDLCIILRFPSNRLRWFIRVSLLVVFLSAGMAMAGETPPKLPEARPDEVGLDADALAQIDPMVAAELKADGCRAAWCSSAAMERSPF